MAVSHGSDASQGVDGIPERRALTFAFKGALQALRTPGHHAIGGRFAAYREQLAMPAHISQADGMICCVVQKMTAVWQHRLDRLHQRTGRLPAACLRRIT
jgi:hypothetical protein